MRPSRGFRLAAVILGISVSSVLGNALPSAAVPIPPNVEPLPNPVAVDQAMFGLAVTGLGDVDGDGLGDVAVGALGVEQVFVFSGATGDLIRTITDPEGLTGNRFGLALADVGDWDGDGVADLAVGAPGDDQTVLLPCFDPNDPCPPEAFQGRVFIFSGATGAMLHKLLPPPGSEFLAFGFAIATMGDVDGDGHSDLAVGSPTRRANKFGQVFAFAGGSGAHLWTSAEPLAQTLASYGNYLAAVDDVNGDGDRDLLVAAPFHDYDPALNSYLLAGRAYVVSGASGAILRAIDNPSPADGDLFGAGLTAVSDETGDGIEEHAVGDPVQGKVFVYRGSDGVAIRTLTSPGDPTTDYFGYPLVRVEDRDGDGRDDLWVAASRAGRIDLMSAAGARIDTVADPSPGPAASVGGFGWALAPTLDLGDDGLRDVIAGEFAATVGAADSAGAAFLIVNDRPPVALCQSVTRDADAACLGAVTPAEVDAGSTDPDGDPLTFALVPPGPYPLGDTAVTLKVTDDKGASDTCMATVTVVDITPPAITGASASTPILWPPDHHMVNETVAFTATDNCDPPGAIVCSLAATSSEPDDGIGDGHTLADVAVVDPHHVWLRAERSGPETGRTYTVGIACADAASNTGSDAVEVLVPHDPW